MNSTVLNNGLKVIYHKDNSVPIISLQLYARIGSNWETKSEAGYSHFLEHLLFKSTKDFPKNSLTEEASRLGAQLNAYTEHDTTCFYLTLPSEFALNGLHILSELGINSDFSPEDFNAERQVVIEELKQYQNDPEDFFLETIPTLVFDKNPYKKPIIGNLKNLEAAKHKDLVAFYNKWYNADNCFLVICGDFDEDKLIKQVNKYFGGFKRGKKLITDFETDKFPMANSTYSFKKDLECPILGFVIPEVAESDPASIPLNILIKALASGNDSRLYKRLYFKEKLIDGIKLHSYCGICPGITIIVVFPAKNADINRISQILLEEYNNLLQYGLKTSEFKKHKQDLIFSHRYSSEYVESLAMNLGTEEIEGGFENYDKYPAKVGSVSIEDVNNALKKNLKLAGVRIFSIGDTDLDEKKITGSEKKSAVPPLKYKKIGSDYLETELDNGMKVALKKVKGKPTVGVSISAEVSQLNETANGAGKGNRGINQLCSTLMLYGNAKRNYNQLMRYCSQNGIVCSTATTSETTTLRLKCFKESFFDSCEVLHDIITEPLFPEEYLQKIKQTAINSLDRIKDYPNQMALKLWKEMVIGKNSNWINKRGKKTDIRRITRKQISEWFKNYFYPANLNLCVVGDIDFDLTVKHLNSLSSLAKIHINNPPQEPVIFTGNTKKIVKRNGMDQSVINLGGFCCGAQETKKNTALFVLSYILGGDLNSRLYTKLREEKGWAYSVGFDVSNVRNLGLFRANAIVDKNQDKASIEIIKEVLAGSINTITAKELEIAKNAIRGSRLMEQESVLHQSQSITMLNAMGFGYQYYLDREKRLANVTLDDLHNVAAEYFKEENYYVGIYS